MRLVFAGSPEAAVPSLRALAAVHDIAAVITREAAPVGRKRVVQRTPVAELATQLSIPVIETNRLDDATTTAVAALDVDLGVIVAYGGIVRPALLATPRHGWINLHFSLLPAYRGAAPVQRALIDGVATTGVSVFQLVEGLDAGAVFAQQEVPVKPLSTADALLAELAELGAEVLASVVTDIADGTAVSVPQFGEVSRAAKLTVADGELDFSADARVVLDRWRGTTSEPGAWATVDGQRVKILELSRSGAERRPPGLAELDGAAVIVGTGSTPLGLLRVQPAGKQAMDAAAWLRGRGGSAQFATAEANREPRARPNAPRRFADGTEHTVTASNTDETNTRNMSTEERHG